MCRITLKLDYVNETTKLDDIRDIVRYKVFLSAVNTEIVWLS